MTQFCAKTKKIIMQPSTMLTIVELTMCYNDNAWWKAANKWFSPDSLIDQRVETIMKQFREVLKNAPDKPDIGRIDAIHMVRYQC